MAVSFLETKDAFTNPLRYLLIHVLTQTSRSKQHLGAQS